jgi:redox-sensing transcriptional repressor
MADLAQVARARSVAIALIATPARSAQAAADAVIAAGITSILNFAPASLDVPGEVQVRTVDLATEVQILAFHQRQRGRDPLTELRTVAP